jgi:anti-sigma factor (TIGR02949 family)
MNCEEVREHLDSCLSKELPVGTSREVLRHVEGCPRCAAELAARGRVRSALRAAVRATPVPDGLEARVQRAVRAQHSRTRAGLYTIAVAAAAMICLAIVNLSRVKASPEEAILQKNSGRLAAVLNVGLRDHLHCAVFRKYSRQPESAAQMASDLGPEFAGLTPLVQGKLPVDIRILQAHRCTAGGREYVHFIMARGDKVLSLILTRKQPGESLAGGIYQAGVDRFEVVGFESRDYLAYVVSDLDAQQNLRLAANLAPAVREYLGAPAG